MITQGFVTILRMFAAGGIKVDHEIFLPQCDHQQVTSALSSSSSAPAVAPQSSNPFSSPSCKMYSPYPSIRFRKSLISGKYASLYGNSTTTWASASSDSHVAIVSTSIRGCSGEYNESAASMMGNFEVAASSVSATTPLAKIWQFAGCIQSNVPVRVDPPFCSMSVELAFALRARLSCMLGRSVRTTFAPKAAIASPTNPVPDPSSSIRGACPAIALAMLNV